MKTMVLAVLTMAAMGFGQKQENFINNYWRAQEGDAMTGFPVYMDEFHHEIHEGDAYEITGYFDLSDGDTLTFWLETPAAAKIHMIYEFNTTQITTMEIFSDCDSIPGSAIAITPRNKNYTSTDTSTLVVKYVDGGLAPSVFPVASYGTKFDSTKVGASGFTPSSKYGGSASRNQEEKL